MTDADTALVSREDLRVLVRNAGLDPSDQQFEEMFDAYQHVKAMLDRLNRDFGFADEPAHVYSPLKF